MVNSKDGTQAAGCPSLNFRLRVWKNIKTNIHTLHASTFLNFKGFLTNIWQFVLQKQKTPLSRVSRLLKCGEGGIRTLEEAINPLLT